MTSRRPTPERFLDALQGFQRTHALRAALELDLFTALHAGPLGDAELAVAVGADARGVRILADFLVALGFLAKDDGRYSLPEEAALYLDRRSPAFLGDAAGFLASTELLTAFEHTAESVRRGGGAAVDSTTPDHPVWQEYARAMGPLFLAPAAGLAEHLTEAGGPVTKVADLAAGPGVFGVEIAVRFPRAELTVVDWPSVLPVVRARAQAAGIGDRYREIPGDAFEVELGSGYDVVILANFLHHFDPTACDRLLRRVAASLAPAGRVVVVEFIPNEDRVTPAAAAQFALTMLTTTRRGDAYTAAELEAMLRRAGLDDVAAVTLPRSPQRALVARRSDREGRPPPEGL